MGLVRAILVRNVLGSRVSVLLNLRSVESNNDDLAIKIMFKSYVNIFMMSKFLLTLSVYSFHKHF